MRDLRSVFKLKTEMIAFVCLVLGCTDIPRDNPLDPKNPNSIRARIIALDVFVNTGNNFNYNQYVLSALDQLKQKYTGQITIAEYHRNVPGNIDSLHLVENEFLYNNYVEAYAPDTKGVPDVFFNGIDGRVQGASSMASAALRLEEALQTLLLQNSFFTIEPQMTISEDQLNLSVRLARLGTDPAENILVKAILIEKIDDRFLKRVVRKILKSDIIPDISAGEVITLQFETVDIQTNSVYGLILNVTSENELTVYQSFEVNLQ